MSSNSNQTRGHAKATLIFGTTILLFVLFTCGRHEATKFPEIDRNKTAQAKAACDRLNALRDMAFTGAFIADLVQCASNKDTNQQESLGASLALIEELGGAQGLDQLFAPLKMPLPEGANLSPTAQAERYPHLLSLLTFFDKASHNADQIPLVPSPEEEQLSPLFAKLDFYHLGQIALNQPAKLADFLLQLDLLQQSIPENRLQGLLRGYLNDKSARQALASLTHAVVDRPETYEALSALVEPENRQNLSAEEQSTCLLAHRQEVHALLQPKSLASATNWTESCDLANVATSSSPINGPARLSRFSSTLTPNEWQDVIGSADILSGHLRSLASSEQITMMQKWGKTLADMSAVHPSTLADFLAFMDQGLQMQATDFTHLVEMVRKIQIDETQLAPVKSKVGSSILNDRVEQMLLKGGVIEVCQQLQIPAAASGSQNNSETLWQTLKQLTTANQACPAQLPPLAAFYLAELGCIEGQAVICQSKTTNADNLASESFHAMDAAPPSSWNSDSIKAFIAALTAITAEKLSYNPHYLAELNLSGRKWDPASWTEIMAPLNSLDQLDPEKLVRFERTLSEGQKNMFFPGWLTRLVELQSQDLGVLAKMFGGPWQGSSERHQGQQLAYLLTGAYPHGPLEDSFRTAMNRTVNGAPDALQAPLTSLLGHTGQALSLFGPTIELEETFELMPWGDDNSRRRLTITATPTLTFKPTLMSDMMLPLEEFPKDNKRKELYLSMKTKNESQRPRLMGKDLPDEQADQFEQYLYETFYDQMQNPEHMQDAFHSLTKADSTQMGHLQSLLKSAPMAAQEARMLSLFFSMYYLTGPDIGPAAYDPQVTVNGDTKAGKNEPGAVRIGLPFLLGANSTLHWARYRELFAMFDPADDFLPAGQKTRSVQEYLDQMLPFDNEWRSKLSQTAPFLLPRDLSSFDSHETLGLMSPLIAFHLFTAASAVVDTDSKPWVVMPIAWQASSHANEAPPCFRIDASTGETLRRDCVVAFSASAEPNALKAYYQDQVRALFCPFVDLEVTVQGVPMAALSALGLYADPNTKTFCQQRPQAPVPAITIARLLGDWLSIGTQPDLDPSSAHLPALMTQEAARQENWDQETTRRTLLRQVSGGWPGMSYESRLLDANLHPFHREYTPWVDAYLSLIRRDFDINEPLKSLGSLSEPGEPALLYSFLEEILQTHAQAVTEDLSALEFVNQILDRLTVREDFQHLLVHMNSRLNDRDSRYLLKNVFSYITAGHLEQAVLQGQGFSWHLPDLRLFKWFLDRRLMYVAGRATRDFSASEIMTAIKLLSRVMEQIGPDDENSQAAPRAKLAEKSLHLILNWGLSLDDSKQPLLEIWQNALGQISQNILASPRHIEDLESLLRLMASSQMDFAGQKSIGLTQDTHGHWMRYALDQSGSLLESIQAMGAGLDLKQILRKLTTHWSTSMAEASEDSISDLDHLLQDERLGISDQRLSYLLTDPETRASLATMATTLAKTQLSTVHAFLAEWDRLIPSAKGLLDFLEARIDWEPSSSGQSWRYGYGIMHRMSQQPDFYLYPQTNVMRNWLKEPE